MNVLIACEESQEVCKAFRARGHNAFSCDIQECSGGHPEWHILGDALLSIKGGGGRLSTMDGQTHDVDKWDLIIAHPPCTYLSNAGACRLYPKSGELDKDRYIKGLKGKEFFMAFYWYGYWGGKIVIENPVPSKVFELPKQTNCIQPYEFGEPWSKKTYLWEFGVPHLMPTEIVEDYKPFLPSGTGRKLRGDSYGARGCAHDGKPRAKTFPGIARAMAEQWG